MIAALRFTGEIPAVLVVVGTLATAAVVAVLYLRETAELASPYNYVLPALRATAVALAMFILAGPVWQRRQTVGTLGRVTFAVDDSRSMSVPDSAGHPAEPNRLERALDLLLGSAAVPGWLTLLSDSHWIEVVAISEGPPRSVWNNRLPGEPPPTLDLSAGGRATNLAAALTHSGTSGMPQAAELDTVVLFSDGNHNRGPSPVDEAKVLAAGGAVVHTIGIGSLTAQRDVGIQRIDVPETVPIDASVRGTIGIHQQGFPGTLLTVRIQHQGQMVWQAQLTASAGINTIPFEFALRPLIDQEAASWPSAVQQHRAGISLTAIIDEQPGEQLYENNQREFRLTATTHRSQLLIIDGSSRWETRYLKNLLERDPRYQVQLLLFGPGTDDPLRERGDQPGRLPGTVASLARFDAIVLGEVPPEQWTADDSERLEKFVERGGGLVIVDGYFGHLRTLASGGLRALIPVEYQEVPALPVASLRPTATGTDHPALELWHDPSERAEFWRALPAPPTTPAVVAHSAAEVLAESVTTAGGERPWLVTQRYGAGRVFYLATDQTWRWRYKVGDRFHTEFWNRLLAAAMHPPYAIENRWLALATDRVEYGVDDAAVIRARLRDSDGQPRSDATVEAVLIRDDRTVATIPLSVDDPARGTFRGQTAPLPAGEYRIGIRASGLDAQESNLTIPIWVAYDDANELAMLSLNSGLLARIAAAAEGAYVHESEAFSLLDKIRTRSRGQIVSSSTILWQSYYWFTLVVLVLAVEWLLRKRIGLP